MILAVKAGSHVRFLALVLALMLASLRRTCEPAFMKQLKQLQRKPRKKNLRLQLGLDLLPARLHSSVGRASQQYRGGHEFESR